jgi:hypothetical protein
MFVTETDKGVGPAFLLVVRTNDLATGRVPCFYGQSICRAVILILLQVNWLIRMSGLFSERSSTVSVFVCDELRLLLRTALLLVVMAAYLLERHPGSSGGPLSCTTLAVEADTWLYCLNPLRVCWQGQSPLKPVKDLTGCFCLVVYSALLDSAYVYLTTRCFL